LVKASTGTPAARAAGTTVAASALVSGPIRMRAPSAIAARAAACAPCGVPPVSRGAISTPLGASSNRAMVPALSIAWPSGACGPVSGSSIAARMFCATGAAPIGGATPTKPGRGGCGAQAPSPRIAAMARPASGRRVTLLHRAGSGEVDGTGRGKRRPS
jgi:hypothetical protein